MPAPLGVIETDDVPPPEQVTIQPGDLFVLLTDGFYGYHNPASELFDQGGVTSVILQHSVASGDDILNHLLAATKSFAAGAPQLDDMTAIVIKRMS